MNSAPLHPPEATLGAQPVTSDCLPEALVSHLVQPHRVHRRLYTDPAIFDLEMSCVFAASWCYVGHESQIPEPGDFTTTTLGGRPLLVTRRSNGDVNVLLNRCTHRGTQLNTSDGGNCRRFRCPYHGWTFSNDGRLVAMPFPANHPVKDRSTLSLGKLLAQSYRGFIFATLNADPEPLQDWLGAAREPFDMIIDRHPGSRLAVLPSPQKLEFEGNWKLSWDNASDGLHATFAHHSYNTLGQNTSTETVLARDPGQTDMFAVGLGNGHMLVDQRPGIPQGPWATMRPTPFSEQLAESLARRGNADQVNLATGSMANLSLFPNLIFVGNQLLVVEPISVTRTRLWLWLCSAPDAAPEIDMMRLRADEDFVSFGTPDDLDMFERAQRGLSIPEMEWVDVSRGIGPDGADDPTEPGPITSEAPQRGYLARYAQLMRTPARTLAR